MQSDCNCYRDLLWSYVSKELSDSESKKVEEHLQGCPSCRQEAEELSMIVASLREEVPLPANFTQELHEKLISVSEEMATEKPSLKEKLLDGLKNLPRSRTFRTLAPSLVCLVLVVGVFSSGLFDRWNSSDEILTDPISVSDKPSPVSVVTEPPIQEDSVSSVTPKAVAPKPAEQTRPATSDRAVETELVPNPPVTVSEPEPIPADAEHLPAPASVEENEAPATLAIPRHRPMIVCLNVEDAETFLNNWQDVFAFDWTSALQDIPPEELISGVDQNAIVLKLNKTAFDSLMEYADAQEVSESQGETLIIIAEDEE